MAKSSRKGKKAKDHSGSDGLENPLDTLLTDIFFDGIMDELKKQGIERQRKDVEDYMRGLQAELEEE